MREIKFRALSKKDIWLYGMPDYNFEYVFNFEQVDDITNYEIKPETIGEFTGKKDVEGKEIYEGDLLEFYGTDNGYEGQWTKIFEVIYDETGFYLKNDGNVYGFFNKQGLVVGNIHQNADMLS